MARSPARRPSDANLIHLSAHRLGALLLCAAIVGGAPHPAQAAGNAAGVNTGHASLRLSPNPVTLGQPLAVMLHGARPGAWLDFTLQPLHRGGFGGGLMGRYRADADGVVRFVYPGPTRRWEVGQWRVYAWQHDSASAVASTILTIAAGHATVAARPRATLILAVPLGDSSQSSYRVQLYRRLAGGVMRPLYHPFTTTDGALAVADIALSSDGRWLSYSDGRFRVHLVALPRGSDRVIGRGMVPGFSPDSRFLAFVTGSILPIATSGMGPQAEHIMVYDLGSSILARIGPPRAGRLNSFAWSPKGDRLAWQMLRNRPGPAMVAVAEAAHPSRYQAVTIAPPKPIQISGGVTWSADGSSLLVWGLAAMGNTPAHPLPLFVLLRQPLSGGPARILIPATPANWLEGIPPAPVLNASGTRIAALLGGPAQGLYQLLLFRSGYPTRRIRLPGEPRQVAYDPIGNTHLVTVWNAYRYNTTMRRATLVDTATGQTRDLGPAVAAFWLPNTNAGL